MDPEPRMAEGDDTSPSGQAADPDRVDLDASAEKVIDRWRSRGRFIDTADGSVFVVDIASRGATNAPPLVVLHGFPTSSLDFAGVVDRLSENRRVVLFDQIGFGLSEKPDRRYGIHLHADTAEAVIAELGLDEIDLCTHDMGDSVGGELLARQMEETFDVFVRRRVITNGSIYLDLAQLTLGQQMLLGLDDALTQELPIENFEAGVNATFAAGSPVDPVVSRAHGLLARANGGLTLMARLIRYLEDRRAEESRYTGAIETHPAPLSIIWGEVDPVAVLDMAYRLANRMGHPPAAPRATADPQSMDEPAPTTDLVSTPESADLWILDGVGHYPMVESPRRFAEAVVAALD